jgi:hypothetical protein
MAKLSIISEEDEEQAEPLGAKLSIIEEADDIEAPAPVPTGLSIAKEEVDPQSPLTTIDVGSPEEPGFFTRALDSFQAWRDDFSTAPANKFTREEAEEITKQNIKMNREMFSNKGGGQFSFGDDKPVPHSALVRAGLEEPPEDEVEHALIEHMGGTKSPDGRLKAEREQWAKYPKDQNGFVIDPTRPIVQNPDGSSSSELSITIEVGGRWFNIPSMVNGKQVSQEQAIESARSWAKKGWIHPNFATVEEAEEAAGARSDYLLTARDEWKNRKPDEPKEPEEEKEEDPWGDVIWTNVSNVPHQWRAQYGGAKMWLNAPRDLAYILEAASDQGVAPENSFALEVEAYVRGKDPAEYYGELLKEAKDNADLQEGLRIYEEESKYLQGHQPNVNEDSIKYYAGAIVGGALNMAPMLVASAVTRSPTVGAAIMGGQVFADQYASSIKAGRSHSQAVMDGTVVASAEILTERIPLGILTKEGGTLLKRMLKAGGAEAIQEPITQVIQEAYQVGIVDDEMTFGEALYEIFSTEEGRAMMRRSAIIGFGVGGVLAASVHPFYKDMVDQGEDPTKPGWVDLPETGPGGKPIKRRKKGITPSETNAKITTEEAEELGLVEVDVSVELLERVAAGDPLTIDEQYTLTNNGYGKFIGADERVMLLPKGRQELTELRDKAAGEEIIMEGDEVTIRKAGEAIDIAAPVEPGEKPRRAQRAMEEFAKIQDQYPAAMSRIDAKLKTQVIDQWQQLSREKIDQVMVIFDELETLPEGEDSTKQQQRLKFILEEAQKAAQEPPDEEGDVVDTEGRKIVVWRGEHGLREDQDEEFQSLVGSLSFGSLKTAQTYALEPNDLTRQRIAQDPRVRGYTLNIKNPIVNTPEDPFIDLAQVRRKLGKKGVTQVLKDHSEDIMNTGKWQDEFADEYDSPAQVAEKSPERMDSLYFEIFQFLDNPRLVEMARKAGFDGAIHMGYGENFDDIEYRIFNPEQATPLPKVQIVMEEDEVSDMEVFRSDVTESRSSIRARLEAVQRRVKEPKSPEQAEAGNYPKGHMLVDSLPVTIETRKGGTRTGIDRKGKPWSFKMKDPYGYIKGTQSREADGRGGFDQIDVFIGPYLDSGHAVIINQKKDPKKPMSLENFDEHKIMLGYRDTLEAEAAYRRNYTDGGAQMGSVVAMTTQELREWLETANTKTPAVISEVVFVPGRGDVDFRPFQPAIDAALAYTAANDIEYEPAKERAQLDTVRAAKIAREFDVMEHAPEDPEVQAAYQAMIDETLAQYEYILESGLEVEFIVGKDPYTSPRDAILDIQENNHLWVYPTREGFGSRAEFEAINNPLLNETKYKISGKVALANDIFRAVHDYFGHLANGFGFRARGEENAWQHHAAMYSPLARRAMTVETRGQNSWVNYGPHGETNRTASAADTVYADQKIGLMPVWVSEEGRLSAKRQIIESRPTEDGELVAPPVSTEGRITLTHFSSRPNIERIDPSFYGQGIRGAEGQRAQARPETWIDRTYYGVAPGIPGGYRKESGLGSETYTTSVDARLMYDLQADPESLAETPDLNETERAIRDAGYSGYWLKHPSLGLVAASFDPLEVEAKKGPSARARLKTNGRTRRFTVEEVQGFLRPVYSIFRTVRPVHVVEAIEDLPPHLQAAMEDEHSKRNTTGMYDQGAFNDDIYIIANNITSMEEAIETLLHEVVGHFGLRQVIPPWRFDEFMDMIAKSFPKQVREIAREYSLDWNDTAERRIAAEEFIAHTAQRILAGQTVSQKAKEILTKILDVLANVVRWATGKDQMFTSGQLMSIIAQSSDFVQKPGGYQRSKQRGRLRHVSAPYFFSAVWKVFNETETKSTSAEGWKQFITSQIKKGKMKQSELDWMGLETFLEDATWGGLYALTGGKWATGKRDFEDVEAIFPKPMFEIYKEQRELGAEIQSIKEKADRLRKEAFYLEFPETAELVAKWNNEAIAFRDKWNEEHPAEQSLPVNEQRDLALDEERHDDLTKELEVFAKTKPKKIPVQTIQSFIERNGVDIDVREPGGDRDAVEFDSEENPDEESEPDEDDWYEHWQEIEQNQWDSYYPGALSEVHAEHDWDPDLEPDPDIPEESDMDITELNTVLGVWDGTDEENMDDEASDKAREAIETDYYEEARDEWVQKNTDKMWYSGEYQIRTDNEGDFIVSHEGYELGGYHSNFDDAVAQAEEHGLETTSGWADYMLKPTGDGYEVLLFRWENPDTELFTETSHWEHDDNFVVHVRFDIRKDPDGNDAFYIDEMQSDWHQSIGKAIKARLDEIHKEHGFNPDHWNGDGTFGGGEEYDGTAPAVMYEQARLEALKNPKQMVELARVAKEKFQFLKENKQTLIDDLKAMPMDRHLASFLRDSNTGDDSTSGNRLLAKYLSMIKAREADAITLEIDLDQSLRPEMFEKHGYVEYMSEDLNKLFAAYREIRPQFATGTEDDPNLERMSAFPGFQDEVNKRAKQKFGLQQVLRLKLGQDPIRFIEDIWMTGVLPEGWQVGELKDAVTRPHELPPYDKTPLKKLEDETGAFAKEELGRRVKDAESREAGLDPTSSIGKWASIQKGEHEQDMWQRISGQWDRTQLDWELTDLPDLFRTWGNISQQMEQTASITRGIEANETEPLPFGVIDYSFSRKKRDTMRRRVLSFNEAKGAHERVANGHTFAPFEKDYQLLVIKHMIAEAQRRGHKRLYFSKGEVHGVRWSGAQSVEAVKFVKHALPPAKDDPNLELFSGELAPVGNEYPITIVAMPGSTRIIETRDRHVRKIVGDRVAKKIIDSPEAEGYISAEDVGLEGILLPTESSGRYLTGSRVIYNQVAVNQINKFLKKFKGKVKDTWVPGTSSQPDREKVEQQGLATFGERSDRGKRLDAARLRRLRTSEVVEHVAGGLNSQLWLRSQEYDDKANAGIWGIDMPDKDGLMNFDTSLGFFDSLERARVKLEELIKAEHGRNWGYEAFEIEITPKLQEAAKNGFPLFHKRGKPKTGDKGLDDALDWANENIGSSKRRSLKLLWEKINQILRIENKQEKMEQAMIDQFAGLKWALRQTHGYDLPAQISAYKQAHFTTSVDSQMYVFLTHGIPEWQTVATAEGTGTITGIKEGSKGLLEVWEPIADKMELWGYWMAARRADRLLKEGREALFSQERIDELLKLGDLFPLFHDVAAEYADWNSQFLDWASEAGVINEDTRKLWEHADYVPFFRIKSDEMGGSFAKKAGMGGPGIANVTQPIKRLLGSKHPLGDIMENILVNFQHIAATTMKNKAAQLAVENLKDSGLLTPAKGMDFLKEEFIPMDELKRKLKQAGVDWEAMPDEALQGMQKMWTLQQPPGDDFISVLYNGKKKWFQVHEETLLRSLTAINERKFASVIGRMFMWPLRKFKRLGTTMITLAPDFMAANWFRDIFMAFVNSRHTKFPAVWSAATGAWKAFTKSPEMVSMMAAGGAFYSGYINANDPVSTTKAMKRALRQTGFKNRILDAPWKLFHLYNDIGAASENANRIGAGYIPAIRAGAGKAEAIWESKDLMNFAKHGDHALVQFFAQSVMFLNARVQGMVRYGQRWSEAPGLTFTKSMMYAMVVLAIWLKNKDDDRYKALPNDDKDMYVHFWTGGKHWRLPKSFEVGMIFGVGVERTFEYYYSNEDDAGKVAIDRMWWVMGEVFNFFNRETLFPLPQAVAPLFEATNNWNAFFQSPIVPEYMQDIAEVKPEIVFRPTTSPTARELAKGMPKWAPATLRNPMLLEHLTRGYFATLGAYVMMLSDDLVRKSFDYPARPDLRWDKIPVVRRFYTGEDPPSRTSYEEIVYQVRGNARQIERAVNKMEDLEMDDEIDAFMEEPSKYDPTFTNEEVVEAAKAMRFSYEEMKAIRKEIAELWEDENMSGEEKGRELNNLLRDKLDAAKEGYMERPGASIQFEALQETLIDMIPGDQVDYLAEQGLGQTLDLLASLPVKPSTRLQRILTENTA